MKEIEDEKAKEDKHLKVMEELKEQNEFFKAEVERIKLDSKIKDDWIAEEEQMKWAKKEKWKDELTCQICFDIFYKPVSIIPCLHNVSCFNKLVLRWMSLWMGEEK